MNYSLKIDTSAAVVFTNRLEKLRRSALPNAVRNTLNKVAFDVKQRTMPVSADKHFTKRKPNFFKANSKVFMAKGYDLNKMESVIGFTPSKAQYNNEAVKELRQQEFSGTIGKRTFIPLNPSRSGGTLSGQVLPSRRLKAIKNIVKAANSGGTSSRQKFVRAALVAKKGGYVIGNLGNGTLYRIESIKRIQGKTLIKKIPVYSYKKGRGVKIKATHFMREASMRSAAMIPKFYVNEAQRQINRVFK